MSEKSGKISRVSQSTQNLMKKQQNMKKLRHEVWDENVERMWKQYGNEMEMEFSFCYPLKLKRNLI